MARRKNFFWLGLILLCSIVAMGKTGYLVELLYHIPILNLFRHAPMYFDLANLGLCLMAAVGMRALWDQARPRILPEVSPSGVNGASIVGRRCWELRFTWRRSIPGWHHMLLVLAVFAGLGCGYAPRPLPGSLVSMRVIGIVVFELCFHGMNQVFNSTAEDPWKTMAYDYEAGRKESLQFLRSDTGKQFSSGGLWRVPVEQWLEPLAYPGRLRLESHNAASVPGIYPSVHTFCRLRPTLLRPGSARSFSRLANARLARSEVPGSDAKSRRSNRDSLNRASSKRCFPIWTGGRSIEIRSTCQGPWFFPKAYVLPDTASELALMNSQWFQPRQLLLIAREHSVGKRLPQAEEIETISIQCRSGGCLLHGSSGHRH